MICSSASCNRNESPFSNRSIRQEAQIDEFIYFQQEPIFDSLEMLPTTPLSRKDQETQTISTQNNGVQTEHIPNPIPSENRHCPEIPSHGNLITITIGAPAEQSKAPTTVVNSNNSCGSAPTPASNGDGVTPPALPLPMLPAPNGITIPPPPQEVLQATGARTGNQNSKCCNACGNCGGCGCGNFTPAHKMYLMYATIAVCASLVIALVPVLATSLVRSKN
jgi:hypothetical protein